MMGIQKASGTQFSSLPLTCLPRKLIMTARKFTLNKTALQTHLHVPKTLARKFAPAQHLLLY